MLFVAAKVSQYAYLPQGQVERKERVVSMVNQMDKEGFGNCTNTGACEIECPKEISVEYISKMNKEYLSASIIRVIKAKKLIFCLKEHANFYNSNRFILAGQTPKLV